MSTSTSLTRREFTATAILATLATACARVAPGTPAPAPTTPAPTSGAPAPATGAAPQPDPNAPLADALLGVTVALYGAHIQPDERPRVREVILRNLRLANRLRGVPIANANDPYSVCVNATVEGR